MISAGPVFDPEATALSYGFKTIAAYQDWHGLKPDGIPGPVTTTSMVQPRCGRPDYEEARPPEESSWPRRCMDVTCSYKLALNLGDDVIQSAWNKALTMWNQVCGINLRLSEDFDSASIWATSGPLSGSTLAWSYLPNGNCRERLEQRYDSEQRWGHDYLAKTILHEIGHAIGLSHSRSKADIMYPSITGAPVDSYPGDGDTAKVVDRYGRPNLPDGPDPVPEDAPMGSRITITGDDLAPGTYTIKKM